MAERSGQQARARRPLSRREVIITVISVLLIVVWSAMALSRLASGNPGAADGATPGPVPSAPASAAVVVDAGDLDWDFVLPSGNIGCALSEDGVTCGIREFGYEPPTVPGCDADTGVLWQVTAQGTAPLCSQGTVDFGSAPVLEYGQSDKAGQFTCTSSEEGVACSNATGHELRLRRADYDL